MGNRSNRLIDSVRAQRPKRLPTILTKEEVIRVTGFLSGTHRLMAKLLYGSGLRLMECVRLWVKDVDLHPRPQSGWPGRPQPAGLACPISRRARTGRRFTGSPSPRSPGTRRRPLRPSLSCCT
jgi:integrase